MTAPTLLEGAPALAWLAAKLTTAVRPGPVALVAVDGRAGSGKSTFALRELLWKRWQERETAFFDSDPVPRYVDLVVDGGC